MSLMPSVEQELMRVARAPAGASPARPRMPGFRRARLSGAVLAVSVSVVAVMIGAGFLVALRGVGTGGGSSATPPPRAAPGRFPGAPRPAPGHFTDRGRFVCHRAPHNRYLPRRAGCVTSVLRADMTGAGQADLVVIYGDLGTHRLPGGFEVVGFTLEVVQPGGRVARERVHAEPFPWITRVGNINGVPGDELVLHTADVSSGDGYAIATFHGGRIELARATLSAGGDSAAKEGFACEQLRGSHTITSQLMVLLGPTIRGRWRWTVFTYVWHGATLRKSGRHTFVRHGLPPKAATDAGGLCGRPTGATALTLPAP